MEAVAAYLQMLREGRKMSRAKLAAAVDVSEMSIYRIEERGQQPRPELLQALIEALSARWADVEALLTNEQAGEEEGRQLAALALSGATESGLDPRAFRSQEDIDLFLEYLREELGHFSTHERRRLIDAVRSLLTGYRLGREDSGRKQT